MQPWISGEVRQSSSPSHLFVAAEDSQQQISQTVSDVTQILPAHLIREKSRPFFKLAYIVLLIRKKCHQYQSSTGQTAYRRDRYTSPSKTTPSVGSTRRFQHSCTNLGVPCRRFCRWVGQLHHRSDIWRNFCTIKYAFVLQPPKKYFVVTQ